jgi:transposase
MKSVKRCEKSGKQIVLRNEESVWVGVDVHKRSYHVAIWSGARGLVAGWVQPASADVLIAGLEPVGGQVSRIVYEAGPTGFSLVRRLRSQGYRADVIAPSKTPQLPGKEAKSDRLDCAKLAMLAAKGLLQPIAVPSEQEEADRQILRLREQVVRNVRRIKQQIKSFLLQHGLPEPAGLTNWTRVSIKSLRELTLCEALRFCLDALLDELDHATAQRNKISARIKVLAATERHQPVTQRLRSVPCVGLLTAMTWRTEIVAPHRFDRPEQVSRMLGLAPCVRQSGEQRREGRLMKSGNPRVRTSLIEAAWRWIRLDEKAARDYRRLLANTGSAKKAITALARKLGIILWRISVTGESYRLTAA